MKATRWHIAAGAGALLALIAVMALLVRQYAAGDASHAETSAAQLFHDYGYLAGFALIYVEESGIPLFIAGDAFLVYVGHRLPNELPVFVVAWLGFTTAVTLGATNLYLLARRYGRSLLEHRLAGLFHLNPRTLQTAEKWFSRWGPWALIFGRHLPGLRVPLTVAAGVLLLPYRVFAISVAVSSSAWAATFLAVGFVFGDSVARWMHGRPVLYAAAAVALLAAVAAIVGLRHAIDRRSRSSGGGQ